MPEHLIAPGEIARPPVHLAPGASFTNPPDAYAAAAVFAAGHTVSDVVRYAIACSDLEEVRTVLDLMEEHAA